MPALPPPTLILRHCGMLLTMAGDRLVDARGPLGIIADGVVVCHGAIISFVGPDAAYAGLACAPGDAPPLEIDLRDRVVMPGLVDPHTHLIFAGERADEYHARLAGATYAEIAARGGGIVATVRATRAAADASLLALARDRLRTMARYGTTTVEAKTGYGLTPEAEDRLLALAAALAAEPDLPQIIPTFLGAHAIPPEFRDDRAAYVALLRTEMLPRFTGRARFCDVFCESGYFTPEESRAILSTARDLGYRLKVHANQMGASGGAAIAAELGATSADHLDYADDHDLERLAAAGVVATLLPGCSLMSNLPYPDARRYLRHGLRVALATNLNPGTSYTENPQLILALAIAQMGMPIADALLAMTRHAAAALALDDRGVLAPGARADLSIWSIRDYQEIGYHFGTNLVEQVIIGGRAPAYEDRSRLARDSHHRNADRSV